jgi:1-acyl-sn-glycerol-3-phosphate acyltransferase
MASQSNNQAGSLVILHSIVIIMWTFFGTILFGTLAILVSLVSRTGDGVHLVARVWGRSILWISGVKVHVHGLEHLEVGRSVIYMSNHQSNFDIPVFLSALPVQFRWLAKAELFKIPIFGRGMRGAGYISLDRSNRKSAMASLAKAAETIRDGSSVLIFPEGTRTEDGNLLPFKNGGFILAVDAGVPIVPMAVCGTFATLPRGKLRFRRQPVHIVVRPPIDAAAYTRKTKNDLLEVVRASIQQAMENARQRCNHG